MFQRAGVPCDVTDDLARAHWEKLAWNVPFNGLGVASCAGLEAFTRDPEYPGTVPRISPSPRDEGTGKGPGRGATTAATGPPLPDPLLPRREERESLGATSRGALRDRAIAKRGPCLTTDQLLADPGWEQIVRELMFEVLHAAQTLGLKLAESVVEEQLARTRTMGPYKASTLIDFERGQPLELESLFLEPLRQAKRAGVPTPRLQTLCAVLAALAPNPSPPSGERAG